MRPGISAKFLAASCTVLSLGCSPSVSWPRLWNPGSAGYQRYSATQQADPYPLPDVGPEVVGGRPRDFQQPTNEVTRARLFEGQRATAPGYTAVPQSYSTPAPAMGYPTTSYPATSYSQTPAPVPPYPQ